MISKRPVMISMLLVAACSIACGSSDTGTTGNGTSSSSSSGGAEDPSSSGDAGSSSGSSGSSGTPVDAPKLATIQSDIFAKSCGGNNCHGAGARGGLKLTNAATSCANLVGVDVEDTGVAGTCATGGAKAAGMKRVVAGDPAASFLYLKVSGKSSCISVGGKTAGERMPKESPALPAAEIAMIEQWIQAGASCE